MRPGDRVRLGLPGGGLDMEVEDTHRGGLFLTCACCDEHTTTALVHGGTAVVQSDVGRFFYTDFEIEPTQTGLAGALEGEA